MIQRLLGTGHLLKGGGGGLVHFYIHLPNFNKLPQEGRILKHPLAFGLHKK